MVPLSPPILSYSFWLLEGPGGTGEGHNMSSSDGLGDMMGTERPGEEMRRRKGVEESIEDHISYRGREPGELK